ncbi:hypothetical protein B0H19DRAFT_1086154 [Mycena capillaripes]|nr:hypothetical protein B0H19DRAFT_1086154 [Mycena capillaripes]
MVPSYSADWLGRVNFGENSWAMRPTERRTRIGKVRWDLCKRQAGEERKKKKKLTRMRRQAGRGARPRIWNLGAIDIGAVKEAREAEVTRESPSRRVGVSAGSETLTREGRKFELQLRDVKTETEPGSGKKWREGERAHHPAGETKRRELSG